MTKTTFRAVISKTLIDRLQPGDIVWDTELKGFGARRQVKSVSYIMKAHHDGRQRWLTIGKHGQPWTPATARKRALELKIDPAQSKASGVLGATLSDLIAEFRTSHYPKLKPRTRKDYDDVFDRYITPKLGKVKTLRLDRAAVAKFHTELAGIPRRANLSLAVISKLMSWAEEMSYRPHNSNPCNGIKRFPDVKRERFLSLDELNRLGQAIASHETEGKISIYAAAAIRLLIFTGARLSEILTLEWEHVDIARHKLWLPDSKTGKKTITLNPQSAEILQVLPRLANNPFVIVGKIDGTHMVNLGKPWGLIRTAADLQDVRIHDLRHSFASVAASEGASLHVIGKLLGHTQAATTARYAHLTEASLQDVSSSVGNAIADALKKS